MGRTRWINVAWRCFFFRCCEHVSTEVYWACCVGAWKLTKCQFLFELEIKYADWSVVLRMSKSLMISLPKLQNAL